MSGFRLHIDIPMSLSEADAVALTDVVVGCLTDKSLLAELQSRGVPQINYRLGHDTDRQRSNYLLKTPAGHVSNKKSVVRVGGAEGEEEI
jgi:hypothetical protein